VDRRGRSGPALLEGLHVRRGIPLCELGAPGGHCHGIAVRHRGRTVPAGHCFGLHTLFEGRHRLHAVKVEQWGKQSQSPNKLRSI